jgi:hypothetical protein
MKYQFARTDSLFTPLPTELPDFGQAGDLFRDPSFNPTLPPQYTRLTDDQTFIGWDGSGSNFAVGGAGDDQHFSLDDRLLWLSNDGAALFVFGLVPETMQSALVSQIPIPMTYGNGHFSTINPNLLYSIDPATVRLIAIDFEGIWIGSRNDEPPFTVLHDFREDGLEVPTFAGVGAEDTIFTAYFGAQDTAECHRVAAWHKRSGKTSILDTLAGTVDGMPVTSEDRFILHGAHLADPRGLWMWLTKSGGGLYAWAVGSPLLIPLGGPLEYTDGHTAGNAQGFFNNASYSPYAPVGYPSLLFRRWVDFGTANVVGLNTGDGNENWIADTHPTTKNDPHGIGGLPVFASTTAPVTEKAYQNEIVAWQQPGPVFRFGRTFNTGRAEHYSARIAVGSVSQTGNFYAFTSDAEGTLDGRYDVFVLRLVFQACAKVGKQNYG